MKYLVVDAELNGTGIRDKYNGGYLDPEELGLNIGTLTRLNEWLEKYADEHYNGYADASKVSALDEEGREIAIAIKNELAEVKLEYFSSALLRRDMID